jgi:hypothetical protein
LVLNPAQGPWQRLEVSGLRIGDEVLSVRLDGGELTVLEEPQTAVIRANADSPR